MGCAYALTWNNRMYAAAVHDEGLMEKFFEQDSLTEDEMREGIRKGLASRGMFYTERSASLSCCCTA